MLSKNKFNQLLDKSKKNKEEMVARSQEIMTKVSQINKTSAQKTVINQISENISDIKTPEAKTEVPINRASNVILPQRDKKSNYFFEGTGYNKLFTQEASSSPKVSLVDLKIKKDMYERYYVEAPMPDGTYKIIFIKAFL